MPHRTHRATAPLCSDDLLPSGYLLGAFWLLLSSPSAFLSFKCTYAHAPMGADRRAFYFMPDSPSPVDDTIPDGKLLNDTRWFQSHLWRSQHPTDCASARFMTHRIEKGRKDIGLGSLIAQYIKVFAYAIATGRVFIHQPDPAFLYADQSACGSALSFDCYFHPLSNCSHLHLQRNNTLETSLWWVLVHNMPRNDSILEQYGMEWYGSQLMFYLLRPAARLQAAILHHRNQVFPAGVPPRLIHMHVRWGDKVNEGVQLMPMWRYVQTADSIRSAALADSRDIFISSEDARAIEAAANFTDHWRFYYTRTPRVSGSMAIGDMVAHLGPHNATEQHFVNLFLALEAEAFVCVSYSGWCSCVKGLAYFWKRDAQFRWVDQKELERARRQRDKANQRRRSQRQQHR